MKCPHCKSNDTYLDDMRYAVKKGLSDRLIDMLVITSHCLDCDCRFSNTVKVKGLSPTKDILRNVISQID